LLRSKLERYVTKRVLILIVLLSCADIVFIEHRWIVLAGLVLGGIFSLLRFGTTASAFTVLIGRGTQSSAMKRSLVKYLLNQAATIALLVASILYDVWLFGGILAGILLVPAVLSVTGIMKGLGLAHIDFE
jgi:hypothetical protein